MLEAIVHTLHVILAGAWLGGVVFTTTVVSPALKSMGWDEAEQARVRSVIGRQYAKVGTANLALLLVFALWEGVLSGFSPALYSEYALLAVLFGLVASHGAYFGRRLVELAKARKEAEDSVKARMLALRRRRLQRLSFGISMLDILISVVVMILATYARAG
jgi:putative copper export protein